MNPVNRAYLELHIAVFLFGFTAILGDLIELSAMVMVWWRMMLTSFSLIFIIRYRSLWQQMPRKLILTFMGIGVIVALHWICFFGSIKLANASIGVICMATTTFFTSLIEPLFLKQRVKPYEIALGLLVIPGMALVVGNVELSMLTGIGVGLLSALLASLFAVMNKKMIERAHPLNITLLELGSGWLFISLLLPFFLNAENAGPFLPSLSDWAYLAVLAFLCTTLAYVLALRSLRHLSAFASNLSINLEPVYGIVLAWLILNENKELSPGFYWGVLLIILAVFSYPLIKRRIARAEA
jgi:drug/metabolite transporter (DMT)-like permease